MDELADFRLEIKLQFGSPFQNIFKNNQPKNIVFYQIKETLHIIFIMQIALLCIMNSEVVQGRSS